MPGLGLAHRKAIGLLLRSRNTQVPLGPVWQEIYRVFRIGRIEGRKLYFTAKDFEPLLTAARVEFGGDPREALGELDRIQAAPYSIDEKQAGRRPDDRYVLIKGALPNTLPALPDELALRVPLEHLDPDAIAQVVLVENLDCFDQIHRFSLPEEWHNALLLYRGHGRLARGTSQLLGILPTSVPICVFPDYDPAGLEIATTLPQASHLLVPQLTSELLAKGSREHFHKQHLQARYLDHNALGGWQAVWAEMKQGGVSVKQQHMLAFGAALRCIVR